MSKYSLSAASLITAIPAGFLAYLLVMAFLQQPGFDKMAGFFQIISGLTLTLVTLMVLLPVGILIFGPKPEAKEKPQKEADEGDLAVEEEEPGFEDEGEDLSVAEDEAEDMFADDEADAFEDDDFGDDAFEDDGFDDFEDDDEFK